jgi:hypothetical protein
MTTIRLPRRQRGAAALGVTLLLLFVLALVVGMAHRNLLFEQRSSANQLRSTRAFEAAEAGLEWAQALLNRPGAIGADCEAASAAPGDSAFRERFLAWDAATGRFAPRTYVAGGAALALQAACVAGDEGWRCSCPTNGPSALDAPDGAATHPAFSVQFVAAPRKGMVQIISSGCDQFGPACNASSSGAPSGGAAARMQATLALLPALATLPTAALTVRGEIASAAALTLVNQDAATEGFTARAGGAIAAPLAHLLTLPGRSGNDSLAALDGELGATDADRLLSRLLGVDAARWQQLAGVRRLACGSECATAITEATAPDQDRAMFWIPGDLALEGPLTLGSAERPLLLVVEGELRLQGAVVIHGVVVTLAPAWDTSGTQDAEIRGALVALGDLRGDGTPTIVRDAGVLARLHDGVGHFVRVAGSWRDF